MMVGKEGTQMFQNKSFCTHQVLLGGGHVIVPELIEDFMVSLRSQVNEPCQAEFARIDQVGGGGRNPCDRRRGQHANLLIQAFV